MQERRDLQQLRQCAAQVGATELLTPEVEAGARLVSVPAGHMIMEAGEPIHHVFILVDGTLRVYSISEKGKQGIVALAAPPQLLGDIEYMQGVHALHSVRAETRATLISFPIADVHRFLSGNIAFYRMVCHNLIAKLYKTSGDYSRSLLYSAKSRFAGYLLERMDQQKLVRFCASEAAEHLGITARHMSRLITTLEQSGVLQREPAKTLRVLDMPALTALADFT